jgi:hypothetical protein
MRAVSIALVTLSLLADLSFAQFRIEEPAPVPPKLIKAGRILD